MASADSELEEILTELNHLSLERQQFLERKKMQCIFLEMKNRAEFGQTGEAASNLHQIDSIDDTLKQLTERKAELQKSYENILNDKDMKNGKKAESTFTSITSCQILPDVPVPCIDIVHVDGPPKIPASTMASADSELEEILTELNHLSLKRQQFLERKKMQCIFLEMKNRAEFGQTGEAASNLHQIDSIDDTLKQLTERKAELQKSYENILNDKDMKNGKKPESTFTSITSCQILPDVPVPVPCVDIVYVDGPPKIPAPTVILDVGHFPLCPCRTQCPECKQFIMTETITSVSSGTWLVCFATALIGCVAGCCFIPFCMKLFKSTKHKCPKCRTTITTIKKL